MADLGLGRLRASRLAARASAAARARRWAEAAALYERALRLRPGRGRLLVQAGHMRKEAGYLAEAERHYLAAAALLPEDADLALQLGHFYRVAGRLAEAGDAYRRAAAMRPQWTEPARELERLATVTSRREEAGEAALTDDRRLLAPAPEELLRSADERLLPGYLPSEHGRPPPGEGVSLRRLGHHDRTAWGLVRTVRGIEAIVGHCITREPVRDVRILLNGLLIHTLVPEAHALDGQGGLTKHVFNVWLDFSRFVPGRYHIRILFRIERGAPGDGEGPAHDDYIVVKPPIGEPALAGSEAWVPPVDPDDPRPLDAQIAARPSIVREAPVRILEPPARVLVLRTDQLGDIAISVPALQRLRALLPEARIVGLLTTANAGLARSLGLFDEVLIADFPDVPEERQRIMTAAEQERLGERLRAYAFDAAIDLAPADISRDLLLLSGAKLTVGFGAQRFPWLSVGLDLEVRDALGHASVLPSADKTLALIEAFGTLFRPAASIVPAPADRAGRLTHFGLASGDRFAAIHDGARIAFSRWPHYPALAERLLARGDLRVILLTDDPRARAGLPASLRDDPRFTLIDERLPFEELDALLSSCILFVGNDSGPKHLAALRGTPVVTVHCARTNWGEWGHGGRGAIVTRRVPCAACHIYHEPEECARGYECITGITVDEVAAAAAPYL